MGERELKVIAAAFVVFCCFAGGVVVYVLRTDSAKSSEQIAQTTPVAKIATATKQVAEPAVSEVQDAAQAEQKPEQPSEPPPSPEVQATEQVGVQAEPPPVKSKTELHIEYFVEDLRIDPRELELGKALVRGGKAEWKEATDRVKTVCGVVIAARHSPDESYLRVILLGGLVKRFVERAIDQLPDADTIAALSALFLATSEKEIAIELDRMEIETAKRVAGKTLGCKLLRVENQESGVILHVEVTNNSKNAVEFLRLQCVLRGFTGDYIDTEDVLIERIPPTDSVITKIRTDVHPDRYSKAVFSIVGKHATEFALLQ